MNLIEEKRSVTFDSILKESKENEDIRQQSLANIDHQLHQMKVKKKREKVKK